MSWKNKPVCGLCMKRYYLDKDVISVSRMTVSKTAGGDLVWLTLQGIVRFTDRRKAYDFMLAESKQYGVLIYKNYMKGRPVTKKEVKALRERGLLDHIK